VNVQSGRLIDSNGSLESEVLSSSVDGVDEQAVINNTSRIVITFLD
jgi:hypothetical protein